MDETIRLGGASPMDPIDERRHDGSERVEALATAIVEKLRLRADDLLVDLGCGAAPFHREILRRVRLRHQIIVVDPSGERLERTTPHPGIRSVRMDPTTFARTPVQYDKILIVDALARIGAQVDLFRRLYARLNGGGALLVVEPWEAWRRCSDPVTDFLRSSGFELESAMRTIGASERVGLITAAKSPPQPDARRRAVGTRSADVGARA
jgi:trans-aconitate methyltransferase